MDLIYGKIIFGVVVFYLKHYASVSGAEMSLGFYDLVHIRIPYHEKTFDKCLGRLVIFQLVLYGLTYYYSPYYLFYLFGSSSKLILTFSDPHIIAYEAVSVPFYFIDFFSDYGSYISYLKSYNSSILSHIASLSSGHFLYNLKFYCVKEVLGSECYPEILDTFKKKNKPPFPKMFEIMSHVIGNNANDQTFFDRFLEVSERYEESNEEIFKDFFNYIDYWVEEKKYRDECVTFLNNTDYLKLYIINSLWRY